MASIKFTNPIALPAPFKAGSCDPVDPRQVVETKDDMVKNCADTFGTVGDYCLIALGLHVYVETEKAEYMYVGPYSKGNGILTTEAQKESNWRKVSDANSSADHVTDKLQDLQSQIGTGFDETNTVKKAIEDEKAARKTAIEALDKEDVAVKGQFVDSVSETDGVITVSRKSITSNDKSVTLNTNNGVDVSVNIDGTTIVRNENSGKLSVASEAIVQYVGAESVKVSDVNKETNTKTISLAIDNDDVLSQSDKGIKSSIKLVELTADELKALGETNVKTAYKLVGKDGTTVKGALVKINKDQTLKSVKYENQILTFTYTLADGTDSVVEVSMSDLIQEKEMGDGIELVDHKVTAKIDAKSENYLTVSADGLKVSGVNDAINAETVRAKGVEGKLTTSVNTVEASVGLAENGDHVTTKGNYTNQATTVVGEIAALDAQVKKNSDAIAKNHVEAADESVVVDNSTTNKTTIKVQFAAAKEGNANDLFTIESGGITMSNIWDCGTY